MNKLIFLESVKKMPLMGLPVRSVYVPVKNGGILISPGSCLTVEQLKTLNLVTDLVAPSLFHCAGIMKAHSVFKDARKWGAIGAQNLKPEISWTDELSLDKWSYQDELPFVLLKGMPEANEVVFFHKESKSLIVTDLCFNLLNVNGFGAWLILSLFGTYKKFAVSKFFLKFVKDRAAFEKSLEDIFAFDFENIIVSHGENIVGDAKNKLLQVLNERNLLIKRSF